MVVLVRQAPDEEAVAGALVAAGEELLVTGFGDGGVLRLSEPDGGRVLVSVDAPMLVETPGELERLLGPEVAHLEPPVWWIEVRASEEPDGAEVPALRFAAELSLRLDGEVWADDPAYKKRAGLKSR